MVVHFEVTGEIGRSLVGRLSAFWCRCPIGYGRHPFSRRKMQRVGPRGRHLGIRSTLVLQG